MTYDPNVLSYETLLQHAAKMKCTQTVYTYDSNQTAIARKAGIKSIVEWNDSLKTREVRQAEHKYYLKNSAYRNLPLTEVQQVKINSALGQQDLKKADSYLSPRQSQALQAR